MTGTSIDLAGPFANLALGLTPVLSTHIVDRRFTATRLYCILLAAFNLMWSGMQLVFSATIQAADWAWAMQELHVGDPVHKE